MINFLYVALRFFTFVFIGTVSCISLALFVLMLTCGTFNIGALLITLISFALLTWSLFKET